MHSAQSCGAISNEVMITCASIQRQIIMSSYHRKNISSEMVKEEIVEVTVLNACIISTYHTNSQWKITHAFSPTYWPFVACSSVYRASSFHNLLHMDLLSHSCNLSRCHRVLRTLALFIKCFVCCWLHINVRTQSYTFPLLLWTKSYLPLWRHLHFCWLFQCDKG